MLRRLRLATVRAALPALVAGLMVAAPVAAQNFPQTIPLPLGWQPEGITAGPGTTVFVGSLADGAIWTGDVRTGVGHVLVPGASGEVAVGTEYEAAHNRVWAAGGPTGAVRVYDASSGALLAAYQFAPGFLNDLVATPDAVYVTDSFADVLDVIPLGPAGQLPDATAIDTLPISGDFAFVPGQLNLNGIVATRGWLVADQTITGDLFRIDPATGVATRIDVHAGASPALSNTDGLELRGSTLFVVQNFDNRIAAVALGPSLTVAVVLREIESPDLDVPATAAFSAGRLWAANARFSTPPTPQTPYWITRLPATP